MQTADAHMMQCCGVHCDRFFNKCIFNVPQCFKSVTRFVLYKVEQLGLMHFAWFLAMFTHFCDLQVSNKLKLDTWLWMSLLHRLCLQCSMAFFLVTSGGAIGLLYIFEKLLTSTFQPCHRFCCRTHGAPVANDFPSECELWLSKPTPFSRPLFSVNMAPIIDFKYTNRIALKPSFQKCNPFHCRTNGTAVAIDFPKVSNDVGDVSVRRPSPIIK